MPDHIGVALIFELIAKLCRSSTLPNDGVINWGTCCFVPHNGGFSLICYTDGSDVLGDCSYFGHSFHGDTKLSGPDFICIVCHPSRLREKLSEFFLRDADDLSVSVEQNASIASSSRI